MNQQLYLFEREKLKLDDLIIIDIEGNGQKNPEIVEIGCVKLDKNANIKNLKTWLIKPQKKISKFAYRIHHISNQDVEDCPSFEKIKHEIFNFINNNPIIGHNVHVDYRVLKRQLSKWEPTAVYDTLKLSRKLLKNKKSYSLENLTIELNLKKNIQEKLGNTPPHRVKYDILVTWALYKHLMEKEFFPDCMIDINNSFNRSL
jgi:exodeoxyribonuclease X